MGQKFLLHSIDQSELPDKIQGDEIKATVAGRSDA